MADDQRLAARAEHRRTPVTGLAPGTKRTNSKDGEKAVGTEGLHKRTPFLACQGKKPRARRQRIDQRASRDARG